MATSKIVKESWEEIPLTITVTTGDLAAGYIKAYRKGDLLMFQTFAFNRAATTSVGANMFTAEISGLPGAFVPTSTMGYYNSSGIPIYIDSTGPNSATITARVIGANLAANCKTTYNSVITRFV